MITLDNINEAQIEKSVITRARVTGSNSLPRYVLENPLEITLSFGEVIFIPSGFQWDLSSVPRFMWGLFPPDGDFELAALIHDYLYVNKLTSRKIADDEMLLWSKVVSGTYNKISIRNLDNQLRYIAVRLFGWTVWNRGLKKNKVD